MAGCWLATDHEPSLRLRYPEPTDGEATGGPTLFTKRSRSSPEDHVSAVTTGRTDRPHQSERDGALCGSLGCARLLPKIPRRARVLRCGGPAFPQNKAALSGSRARAQHSLAIPPLAPGRAAEEPRRSWS